MSDNNDNIEDRMIRIRNMLRYHDSMYYVKNEPSISDAEYDNLLKALYELEEEYPEYITSDSPTQRIGDMVSGEFPVVKHTRRMLSLANGFDITDITKYLKSTRECGDYSIEPKIDGVAISLIYINGKLERAVTRGDGRVGEDVTSNVRTIKSIPLAITVVMGDPVTMDIRGEIYMTRSDFDKLNCTLLTAGQNNSVLPVMRLLGH